MKWIILSMLIPSSTLFAKGLDKLQPDTEAPPAQQEAGTSTGPGNTTIIIQQVPAKPEPVPTKGEDKDEEEEEPKEPGPPPPPPVEPGFQKFYIGTGIGFISVFASQGTWNAATTGDLEFGSKVMQLQKKYDVYGTFRYRPADVTVEDAQRSYRGIVETYLLGAKVQMQLTPSLVPFVTGEFGMSRSSLKTIDGLPDGNQSLAKSGVDLSVGGGVSYIVLDKLAVGTRLHLGVGTFRTIQFGFDLRYLL